MAGIINTINETSGATLSSDHEGKDKPLIYKESMLNDRDIYELLIRIDDGHLISEEEQQLLSSVMSIEWTDITELPNSMKLLASLSKLDLSGSKIRDIAVLSNLTNLTTLKLWNTYVSDISALSNLKALLNLHLSRTVVSNISVLSKLTSLSSLDLSGTKISDISALSNLTALSYLSLAGTEVSDIRPLSNLTSLLNLNLSGTKVSDISALSNLESLTYLNLTGTEVGDISALSKLTGLANLDLRNTEVSDISALSKSASLSKLNLSGAKVSNINPLSNLTSLLNLNLSGTEVSDISALSNLKALETLDLSELEIKDLSSLSGLTALRRINLQKSKTAALPESLLDLNLNFVTEEVYSIHSSDEGIYIHRLTLTDQPIEIFSQSRELIRAYYKEGDQVPVNECKVIFLGDAGSGKTYAIKRLLCDGDYLEDFYGESTPGIEITVSSVKLDNTDIVINYWDFGGQEIQHSMHRMFLTERAAYVVFLNARQDVLMNERARYWMENIKAFAPEAPVLVVINNIDQNVHPRFDEKGFIDSYGDQVKKIIRLSAKKDEKMVFLEKLQGSINSIIMDLSTVSNKIPRSWKNLMENIRTMPDYYLTQKQFFEKCKSNNIKDYDEIHDDLVDLLQALGIGFCYHKDRSDADYMLLNPKWMLNALYTIVIYGRVVVQNGVIRHDNLYDLLGKNTVNEVSIRRVIPELRYKNNEVDYILSVTRMFGLSYSLKDGSEFFPMLCDGDEKIAVKDAAPKDALHFIFRYSYLPTNVMHRLIVEMQGDLDNQYVWYTGAVFRNTQQNQAAYIHSVANELHLYVFSEEEKHNPNKYLSQILDIVRNINKSIGLSATEFLTYRKEGIETVIPAEDVVVSLREGFKLRYDPLLHTIISYEELARLYLVDYYTVEDKYNSFFQKFHNKCPHFSDLQQFIEDENSEDLKEYLQDELGDLFRFADAQNSGRQESEIQELLELLWKLYLIDSNRIKKVEISNAPNDKPTDTIVDESNGSTTLVTNDREPQEKTENKDITKQHKPESSDLENATKLVLQEFEKWWEKEADREGLTFSIEKHTEKQRSGTQFGYDVGLNTRYGGLKYRLRFECKNYTSNISDSKQGEISELPVSRYAYNLLEYYMECRKRKSEVNMRWVLICPFGGLQNDFPERLFEHWNEEHTFIKIYAIMEDGPALTCKDFLSASDEAYHLIYNKDYDGNMTKDDVFKKLKDTIIGVDDVNNHALERLKEYKFWEDYGGHKELLSVPYKKNQNALDQVLSFLQSNKDRTDDENRTLFVIGKYGTGKSWLCYQAIEQIVLHPNDFHFMPFYLRLKELSQKEDLEDKTQYKYIMKDTLSTFFNEYDKWAGECVQKDYQPVFFLDGFDEVISGLSATDKKIDFLLSIINELKKWYEKQEYERKITIHTKPRFVITSRESDFEVGTKSEEFQKYFKKAETIELELCSVEEVEKAWKKLEEEDHTDRSWIFKMGQNSAFLNIIRRPVFFGLCSEALDDADFKEKVGSASADEVDVLDILFEKDLQDYAVGEGLVKNEIRSEIYRCAVVCNKEKKSKVEYKGRGINQIIHVGMVKIEKEQNAEGTCWVSFEHNIVLEYLTAKCLSEQLINCSPSEIKDPTSASFIKTLQELSMTPEALKFLLLCIEKKSPKDKGAKYKQQLKKWLCHESIKKSNSCLPARLLEILLQPGHTLSGDKSEMLDLSGLYASELCLWNCGMQHVNLSHSELRNWQMINMELDDVDLRGANMEGLRIAPDKPISSFCYWKDEEEWHVAALHENGQLMQYSFPENSWNHYSAEILTKTGVKDGLFRFGNELILHSVKKLYDIKKNELYQIRSNNELKRIVTAADFCGFISKQGDYCQAIVFLGDKAPITYSLGVTKPKCLHMTENGYVLCARNNTLNVIYENGEVRKICEWESDYECFAARLEPIEEACIYIKCSDRLIRVELDEELNERVSYRKELHIQGDLETMRELYMLNETALAAVGKNELYIFLLEKNKDLEIAKSRKLKTAITIKNTLLEDEDGSNRVQDAKAYELLCASMG